MIIKDVHRLLIAIGVSLYILSPAVTMLSLSHYILLSFVLSGSILLAIVCELPLAIACAVHFPPHFVPPECLR